MKFILQVFTIATLAYVSELFLPWWSVAIAAGIIGYFIKSNANFFAGFLAIGLLWLLMALQIDNASPSHLAEKIAMIFTVTKPILMIITSLLGGIVGGLGALTGSLLRLDKNKSAYYK